MLLTAAPEHGNSLMLFEGCLAAIAFAASYAWPRLGSTSFARVERTFAQLAHRRGWAVVSVAVATFLLRLAILPLSPIPLPFVPDDFSFLLAADTFAHGRLTNPTPALWTHFETVHVTMWPTYQSMYFPGEGLQLAVGKLLLGNPWFAVLIASALMCAALCWMLQAWLPANWALLGGMLALLRIGLFSYWTNTFHSGASLTAMGGALVLGAMPRLMRTKRLRYSVLLGIGIVLLVLTRPYEGFLLCLPVAVVLCRWLWQQRRQAGPVILLRYAAAPLLLTIAAAAWMGYYDYRAFGSPTTLPYTIDRNTYAVAPYYIWQSPRPVPAYRHAMLREFYQNGEMEFYYKIHSLRGILPQTLVKLAVCFLFYAGMILLIPMLMVRRVLLDRRLRFLVVCTLILAAGMSIEIYMLPHYVAPFTAAFYAIGLQAMRHLRVWKPEGRAMGLALQRLTIVVCVALAGMRLYALPLHFAPSEYPPNEWNSAWPGPEHFGTERAAIESQMEQRAGNQLLLVRASAKRNQLDQWVYNDADIDASKVVWAWDMGAADNLKLMQQYPGRTTWLVDMSSNPAAVSPYSGQAK